jgi:hypothetical protein
MAYSPYSPYTPQYYGAVSDYKAQYQMPIPQAPQAFPSTSSQIWIDNEEQARNYLVAPNNAVPMFDKNRPYMYVKSADGAGMPTFKKYELVDRTDAVVEAPNTEYITKAQFEAEIATIKAMINKEAHTNE